MADAPKPYGNVAYADPENGKYPIDTEDHARAALSYFSMPKNRAKYDPEKAKSIMGRIKAACKRFGIEVSKDSDKEERSDYTAATEVETRSANMSIDGVDFGQRIITVLAVPYEQPTKVPFRQEIWNEVFSRTAFNGIEARAQRVPATAVFEIPAPDHRGGRLVGRVIRADSHDTQGLITDVKISETELGTELLQLARDDALSASIGFMVRNPYRDQELNRQSLTRRINKAFLDHLAFVGQPAYEGTRILSMRAEDQRSESQVFTPTPKMDMYLNDPILRWAQEQVQK